MSTKEEYLLKNFDILATAAGYTRNKFLAKVRIHPTMRDYHIQCGIPLTEAQCNRIEKVVQDAGDPWLDYIFGLACSKELVRTDICRFGTEEFKDKSRANIMRQNLRAFRYFFELTVYEIAKVSGCSPDTVYNIEKGRLHVSEKTCSYVYQAVRDIVDSEQNPGKRILKKRIFRSGMLYPILTEIPHLTRC